MAGCTIAIRGPRMDAESRLAADGQGFRSRRHRPGPDALVKPQLGRQQLVEVMLRPHRALAVLSDQSPDFLRIAPLLKEPPLLDQEMLDLAPVVPGHPVANR